MSRPTLYEGGYEVNGIWGRGDPPPCAGCSSGPALILGSGACVWDDLLALKDLPAIYISVAEAGMFLHLAGAFQKGRLRHWVSIHPEYFPVYRFYAQTYQDASILYHTQKEDPQYGVDCAWNIQQQYVGGTSSLLATFVALGLGFAPVILCGVPLDRSSYFYGPPNEQSNFLTVLPHWEKAQDIFAGRVKSMSGNTAALLGRP